jgi:1-acyl-sn-glycerol-3-phosphate acyltransferase
MKKEGLSFLPGQGAFILLPKHQRWEDIPLLGIASPRPLYYVAKHELFINPLSRWFLRGLGGIPINRVRPLESRASIKAMMGHLKEGEGLTIFPEGTYVRDEVGPARAGLIRMISSRFVVPFIPVGFSYSGSCFHIKVTIRFGKPLFRNRFPTMEGFIRSVMKEIAHLSEYKEDPR